MLGHSLGLDQIHLCHDAISKCITVKVVFVGIKTIGIQEFYHVDT
jgi:hypothetical protein